MNNGIRAAETCNEHFDIQNSLFDILRFVESAKEKGSRHIGMSPLLLNETLTCRNYEAISSLTETAIL